MAAPILKRERNLRSPLAAGGDAGACVALSIVLHEEERIKRPFAVPTWSSNENLCSLQPGYRVRRA